MSIVSRQNEIANSRKNYFWPGTIEAPADSPSFINFRTANTFVLLTEAGDLHNQDYSTYRGI
jgi:hypothetical protein